MAGIQMTVDNRVEGRLALITGASGGIGSAVAGHFASAGINLALGYSSSLALIESLKEELAEVASANGFKITITAHKADLGDVDQIAALLTEVVEAHGTGIDILVSNAGYGKRITNVWDIPLEEFDKMYNVNLRAAFLLVKGVSEHMRDQRWGRIIFVSSIAAYGAGINGCHYAASKAGLTGMMKNLSARLAQYNISVNDVAPALVGSTGMLPSADSVPGIVNDIPLGRLNTPKEVANIILMFATTGFVTGQSLVAGGGLR